MKKIWFIILALLCLLVLSSCGETASGLSEPALSAENTAQPESSQPVSAATMTPAVSEEIGRADSGADVDLAVDIDLTLLSSTMVYSEVYNMVYDPESYEGKTVKITGIFLSYEVDGKIYFSCIIPDATACCAQGLEFELKDNYIYPDDYPEQGAEITILGTFTMYQEEYEGNYYMFLILKDAEFA